jgi:hypothetical protein
MQCHWPAVLLVCFSSICFSQAPVPIGNADFDSGTVVGNALVPTVWRIGAGAGSYIFECDTTDKVSGYASGRLQPTEDRPTRCCHVDQRLDSNLLGTRVRVQAAIKASANILNNAQLVLQVGDTRNGGWRQEQWTNISGFQFTNWHQIDKEVSISSNGNRVVFTIYMKPNQALGTTIWVDGLSMTNLSVGVDYRPSVLVANPSAEPFSAVYSVDGRLLPPSVQAGRHGQHLLARQLQLMRDASRTCVKALIR